MDWTHSSSLDKLHLLGQRVHSAHAALNYFENYYEGLQPSSFLPADVATQLQNRLRQLSVNYPRLTVSTLVERLTVSGFVISGPHLGSTLAETVWSDWQRNNMRAEADWILRDALTLGRGYASVWADSAGNPTITVESPHQIATYRDPVTRRVLGAVKKWSVIDDLTGSATSYATLYLPTEILHYTYKGVAPSSVYAWELVERLPNPLNTPPIVEFINRSNVLDVQGSSEFAPILGLVDALNKAMLDSVAASDAAGFVRRWATGLELDVDEQTGEALQQFSQDKNDVWLAENPDTKFGQFAQQSLAAFSTQAEMLTRQIGAIAGLPDHLLGLASSNPTSADAIRAAELGLTTKAQQKADLFGTPFAELAALVTAIRTGRRVETIDVSTQWANIENRSEAQAMDSVSKAVAAGIPLRVAVKQYLGWDDDQLAELPTQTGTQGEAA